MSKQWEKYLQRCTPQHQVKILECIQSIKRGAWEQLDIKPMIGTPYTRRAKVGSERIVFRKNDTTYTIIKIGTRGDIYK